MSPDLLDDLRDADPARRPGAPADPDWNAMAARIVQTPRRGRRRALALVPALATAAAAVAIAAVALQPADEETDVARPAAPPPSTIYHYVVEFRELEGPDRRPVPDAHSRREGWVDPKTGQIHEVGPGDGEFATDGKTRRMRSDAPPLPAPEPGSQADSEPPTAKDGVQEFPEPAAATADPPDGTVLDALTRLNRIGPLGDDGITTLEGRRVRRFVAENDRGDFRQTFFVDAETGLPVLFRTETGDYLRKGGKIPADQRIMEDRFEVFEALPPDTDRAVLELSAG